MVIDDIIRVLVVEQVEGGKKPIVDCLRESPHPIFQLAEYDRADTPLFARDMVSKSSPRYDLVILQARYPSDAAQIPLRESEYQRFLDAVGGTFAPVMVVSNGTSLPLGPEDSAERDLSRTEIRNLHSYGAMVRGFVRRGDATNFPEECAKQAYRILTEQMNKRDRVGIIGVGHIGYASARHLLTTLPLTSLVLYNGEGRRRVDHAHAVEENLELLKHSPAFEFMPNRNTSIHVATLDDLIEECGIQIIAVGDSKKEKKLRTRTSTLSINLPSILEIAQSFRGHSDRTVVMTTNQVDLLSLVFSLVSEDQHGKRTKVHGFNYLDYMRTGALISQILEQHGYHVPTEQITYVMTGPHNDEPILTKIEIAGVPLEKIQLPHLKENVTGDFLFGHICSELAKVVRRSRTVNDGFVDHQIAAEGITTHVRALIENKPIYASLPVDLSECSNITTFPDLEQLLHRTFPQGMFLGWPGKSDHLTVKPESSVTYTHDQARTLLGTLTKLRAHLFHTLRKMGRVSSSPSLSEQQIRAFFKPQT